MNEDDYIAQLTAALAKQSDSLRSKIGPLLANLPEKAQRLDLVIFPGQDGEGDFTVRGSLDGPDLFVLNKAIDSYAELISVKHTPEGFDPDVPMVDPFDTEFEVNDVLTDCVAKWLSDLWEESGPHSVSIPVTIVGHDDYGQTTPIELK